MSTSPSASMSVWTIDTISSRPADAIANGRERPPAVCTRATVGPRTAAPTMT
jgi:hypothetical protein